MKRFISVIIAAAVFMLSAVCAFAVTPTAKFSVNIVSETDTSLKISVDYEGGAEFNCFDFEIKYNDKLLRAEKAYDGNGMDAFSKQTKLDGGATISSANPAANPLKATFATTMPFKPVDGKDLFIVEFTKLSESSVKESDIELKFTNCQTGDFSEVNTSVEYKIEAAEKTTAVVSDPTSQKENVSSKSDASGKEGDTKQGKDEKTSVTSSADGKNKSENSAENTSSGDGEKTEKNKDTAVGKLSDGSKIKVVAVAAGAALVVIAAGCAAVVIKSKKDEKNTDE